MAAQDVQPLLTLGPFKGLDLTKAGPSVEAGHAVSASNANPTVIEDALTAERGRVNMNDFSAVLSDVTVIVQVQQFSLNATSTPQYILGGTAVGGGFAAYLYNPSTRLGRVLPYAGSAPATLTGFDQAVQYGGVVYFNNGYRLFLNQQVALGSYDYHLYAWQYPPPNSFGNVTVVDGGNYPSGFVSTTSTGPITTTGSLVAITPLSMANITNGQQIVIDSGSQQEILIISGVTGTTFQVTNHLIHDTGFIIQGGLGVATGSGETFQYLFTQVKTMPDGTVSESSANTDQIANPPAAFIGVTTGSQINVTPTGPLAFAGTSPLDGSPYTTNVYRSSTQQPTFFFLRNVSGTFIDVSPDSAIVGNAQIQTRDQPPVVPGSYGTASTDFNLASIEIHKGRAWVYVIVQNESDGSVPEVQLWYSNLGAVWEFDQVNQVLLLQSDVVNQYAGSQTYDSPYGNDPLGMAEVGTFLMAHSRRQTWAIYGDTPSNFLARENFNIGCVSRHSITSTTGGEFWLSENGAYWFDGSSPQYIDEGIRGLLQSNPNSGAISESDQRQSTGFFSNMTWYLAFPSLGYTLGYYMPTGKWLSQIPYCPNSPAAVSFTPANPNLFAATGSGAGMNEVAATRSGSPSLVDWLFADANLDLGLPQTATWTGPLTWCGEGRDSWEKVFAKITLTAPVQPGTATVTLTVDPGLTPGRGSSVFSVTFDLSTGTRHITSVGDTAGGLIRGFLAQLSVTVTGAAGEPAPQIWKVTVWGDYSRNLVIPV